MWAILNDPACKQDAWTADDFFQTGRDHIKNVLQKALPEGRGKALDFGCGIGRLTQALAGHFESVDGVDISNSMIENAKKLNRFPDRVTYHLNQQDNLSLFPSNQYDFVCSVIVLQHMPSFLQRNYIGEFIRLLKPGGIVFFQCNHTRGWRSLVPDWVSEFYRKIKYKNGAIPYTPHYGIPVKDVREIIKHAGGTIVKYESAPYTSRPNRWRSDDFCVKKLG
jgi:ubiquinone/menaquinone biosynthesis C-methylase UbiE